MANGAAPFLVAEETRTCKTCGVEKSIDQYRIQRVRKTLTSGEKVYECRLRSCIECGRAKHKAWRDASPERMQFWAEQSRVRPYGITVEEYQALWDAQVGLCAVCCEPETSEVNGKPRMLAVDHDHVTGAVRGLLCTNCNNGLGRFKDDPARLDAAAAYLRKAVDRG